MTITSITPFLWFDACAEEAANFYVSLFPNSKITHISRYGEGARMMAAVMKMTKIDIQALKGAAAS